MAHAASQLKKNRDLEINAEEETEKKRKHRKRSRDRKKKVAVCLAWILFVLISCWHLWGAFRPSPPHAVWGVNWVCKSGTAERTLWQTLAVRWARPGKGFSSGAGDAGLCGRCAVLYRGRGGLHDTERCCEGVQSTFSSRARSRLNGPPGLGFKAEAGRAGLCTSWRSGSWKSSFCAGTVSHVHVAQADL